MRQMSEERRKELREAARKIPEFGRCQKCGWDGPATQPYTCPNCHGTGFPKVMREEDVS